MATSVDLSAIKILRTGADGGHLYIKARGMVPGHGECDIYAYFKSKEEERNFEHQFIGQSMSIETQSIECTRGIGGSIREINSWKFI
jgi:hypothetical protein